MGDAVGSISENVFLIGQTGNNAAEQLGSQNQKQTI